MQCQIPQGMEYLYVNPYEITYRNMNFQINESITRDTAQKIARQLGYMHNAFGIVAKDLIKIVSLRFNQQAYHKEQSESKLKEVRVKKDNQRRHQAGTRHEPMDVEEKQGEDERQKRKVLIQMEDSDEEEVVGKGEKVDDCKGLNSDGIGGPPNSDIFNEFAYNQSGLSESNVAQKDNLSLNFKDKLSKIVEEVSNKKTKPNFVPSPAEQQQIQEMINRVQNGSAVHEESKDDQAQEEGEKMNEGNESEKKEGQFKKQQVVQAAEQGEKQSTPSQNQVRMLLNQPHEPSIYEISDDDD